jgi:hypothetical protein
MKGEEVIGGRFIYFGDKIGGNNVSEALSMKEVLSWIKAFDLPKGCLINIIGDNKLCISFMRREARPRMRQLVTIIDECKVLVKQIKYKVAFFHVKREYNKYADFLS